MKLKRATAQLQRYEEGRGLEVHKGLYGYVCRNPALTRQRGKVFKSVEELIDAVLLGYRPVEVTRDIDTA